MSKLGIVNLTKRRTPVRPFAEYKEKILGPNYDLSLVFCGPVLTRRLNQERRHETKVANILSFPLSNSTGEIFINLSTTDWPIDYLFIHGLLHLKGFRHGSKMEAEEKKFLSSLKNNGQSTNYRRAGRGNHMDTARRLRI